METWNAVFADASETDFAALASDDVVLEASVLASPVRGRDAVFQALRAAGDAYDQLAFTHEASTPDRLYLEWEAQAFGLSMAGLTSLELDANGLVAHVGIYHRPLAAVRRFAAELGNSPD